MLFNKTFFFLEKVETTKLSYVYKESVLILVVILFRFFSLVMVPSGRLEGG